MTTTQLQLPRPIEADEGDHLQIVLDCVAGDGGFRVEEMTVKGGTKASASDKQAAIERMRSRWKGVGHLTDQEIADLRYDAIMEKHGKGWNP